MNEAMPQWRTFSSPAVGQPVMGDAATDRPGAPPAGPGAAGPGAGGRERTALLVSVLAALGGAAAGAAAVVLAVLVMGAMPSLADEPALSFGEPIGADHAMALASEANLGTQGEIIVDVAGAVARPGLQRLRDGDRVGDAIEAAGGYGPRVDLVAAGQSLNLAQPLVDGTKVLVPELGVDRVHRAVADDPRIDLNEADQASLESLPGVGPVTATKIIAARAQQRFSSPQDLRERGLVGDAVFEDIESLVRAS